MNYFFETHGCTANKADTDIMKAVVEENGGQVVQKMDDADTVVLNTCIVIGKTENRMFRRIEEILEEDKQLVVAGCLSAVGKERVRSIDPNIKILQPEEPGRIAEMFESEVLTKEDAPARIDGVVGRVQISEGCLGECSYCITKFARGSLTSFSEESVLKKIRKLVSEGAKEIRLTAQDTAAYGKDIDTDLPSLMSKINSLEGDFKVRVGMMNPWTAKPVFSELLEELEGEKFYNFLHLPVQSGSEKVLNKMRRHHKPEDFSEMIERGREKIDLTVSTDVIIGFPGETGEEFEKTVGLLERTKPDIINITRFSPRKGTLAYSMKKPSANDAKKRSKKITEMRDKICGKRRKKVLDEELDVLVVEKGKEGTVIGRDNKYTPVVVKEELTPGEFVKVKVVESKWSYVVGELVE